MKILIINGPNLNLITSRNSDDYGNLSLVQIQLELEKKFNNHTVEVVQFNSEKGIVDAIHSAPNKYDGLVINPGGLSHTSISIRDALEICTIPKIEVHLSNISNREYFRSISITASKCNGYISGFKYLGYKVAVELLLSLINE